MSALLLAVDLYSLFGTRQIGNQFIWTLRLQLEAAAKNIGNYRMTKVTLRQLNRTLLQRNLLPHRHATSPLAAVRHLVGLQSQVTNPPYIGLWARLVGFERETLTLLMRQHEVVRGAAMRSTLHLMAADDYLQMRAALQPALTKGLNSFFGQRIKGLDLHAVAEQARALFAERPHTFAEVKAHLVAQWPDRDPEALSYVWRTFLPLVQVPPAGSWGVGGSPLYALLEPDAQQTSADMTEVLRRYLRAFGPASVKDFQAWFGAANLKSAFDAARDELVTLRLEAGNELYDLSGENLAAEDVDVPPVLVPEYDNLVLAHDDRSRIVPEGHRKQVYLSAGRVRAVVLLDGFVAGVWSLTLVKGTAKLLIELFNPASAREREYLHAEAIALLRFAYPEAAQLTVDFNS
jgi:hypothetical protein